ncbi:MAG TPA: prepilin-type N-terminal cleavage/methylation domain-containing protein [Casimicrobiaceae bacterium]|nr:prepilin-type N-terminal cleavage/methylation domain-containing protein [Casimicrobiaceae bacterium]
MTTSRESNFVGLKPDPRRGSGHVGLKPDPRRGGGHLGLKPEPRRRSGHVGLKPDPRRGGGHLGLKPDPRREGGFTLVELLVALALLALLSATLFGSLAMSGRSWDAGEAKAAETASMRTAQEFLRATLEGQHGQRMKKMPEWPLLFAGDRDEMRYAAALPARVQGGGVWYYRLRVVEAEGGPSLVVDRMVPDVTAAAMPDFGGAEHSVLATGIRSVTFAYLGLDPGASRTGGAEPAWRDRWQDTQRLPQLIRIDVETEGGAKWPTFYVAPREDPEAGCRGWDNVRARCTRG